MIQPITLYLQRLSCFDAPNLKMFGLELLQHG